MKYMEFREKNFKKLNDFIGKNFVFCFGQKQYESKLQELHLTDEEFKKQYVNVGSGLLHKDKVEDYKKLSTQAYERLHAKMKSDFEFAKNAFKYEFDNHECYYSCQYSDALCPFNLTRGDLEKDNNLSKAYQAAYKDYTKWCDENL